MPFDSFGSNLESEISKLEAQKEALQYLMDTCQMYYAIPENKARVLRELVRDLARQKEWKEWQLRGHRERVKEQGIKF